MARNLAVLDDLTRGDTEMLVSFHRQVGSGRRIPLENAWDPAREAVESAVNPFCWQDIQFAALSLDGDGDWSYGAFAIALKSAIVAHRTSFFEENPFTFAKRHKLVIGQAILTSYRSNWQDRDMLAVAKLHAELDSSTQMDTFPRVLLKPRTTTDNGDFIEARIYASLHRLAIERVRVRPPRGRLDLPIWKSVKARLVGLGVVVEEV